MKKRLLSVLLCLCMVVALLPTTALAAGTAPAKIYICGMELTDGKCLTSNTATSATDYTTGDYVALYKDGILHLKGLNKSYAGVADGYRALNWSYSSSGAHHLVIELVEGSVNRLEDTNYGAINGASGYGSDGPSLTIQGKGTLNVTGKTNGIWVWTDVVIQDGATVNVTGNGTTNSGSTHHAGICTNASGHGLTIKQGTNVTISGEGFGVSADNTATGLFTVLGGNLVIRGKTAALHRLASNFAGNTVYVSDNFDGSNLQAWNSSSTTSLTSYQYIKLSGFGGATTYNVATDTTSTTNGSFAVDYTKSMAGETVTITASPDSGYKVNTVTVTDTDSGTVAVSGTGNTRTFTMPAKDVTVKVTFQLIPTTYPVTFTGGDGATGTAPTQAATAAGGTFALPANTFTKAGYTFAGWNDGTTTYQAGDTYTMPDHNVTFTAQWTANSSTTLEGTVFGYAYDVQRRPAYPKAGDNVEFWGLDTPKAGGGPSGSWTLTRIGTYSTVKVVHPELKSLVQKLAGAYTPTLNKDTIVIHELKNGDAPVAYGVVTAYDAANGYAAFIDASDLGYLLSKTLKNTGSGGDTVTVTAGSITDGSISYTVTFDANGGSVSPASASVSAGGTLSSLPTPTHSGSYSFVGWYTAPAGGTQVTTSSVFNSNTTIYAQWAYTGGSYTPSIDSDDDDEPTYKVESEVSKDTDGTISSDHRTAEAGDEVTIKVSPDRYYKVDDVVIKDQNGKVIPVTDNKDGTFTFKMPSSKVTVEPVFSWDNPFADVAENAYYASAVEWALKNDITNGSGDASFSPDTVCTRAQIVTFLWRAAGCPEPAGTNSFTDVSADAYYAKAVAWAVEQGITNGTGGKFSPDAACTRAQVVAFLWRAEGSDAAGTANSFADVPANAYYTDAVNWAVENSITGGTSATTFSPAVNCTRAQIVTFLYRDMVE